MSGSKKPWGKERRYQDDLPHAQSQWLIRTIGDLKEELTQRMERMEKRLSKDIKGVRTDVSELEGNRLRPVETMIAMAKGAAVTLVAVVTLLGGIFGWLWANYDLTPKPDVPRVEITVKDDGEQDER